jgi:sulfatase-modifying factor enzyme 1
MKGLITIAAAGVVFSFGILVEPVAAACPADSVPSGTVCMDKYEASVWDLAPVPAGRTKAKLITMIQSGTVTLAGLQSAGAIQRGLADGDLAANGCPATGNGCLQVYAVSIPGVTPSAFVTWFQAAAAARNSLKRLPTNQEWQVAALGTPDTGTDDGSTTCTIADTVSPAVTATGSRSSCVSDVGAFDMVGNLEEFVSDWSDVSDNCTTWAPNFGGDLSCFGGPPDSGGTRNLPAAVIRGGGRFGSLAGVFALVAQGDPSASADFIGFRCAR